MPAVCRTCRSWQQFVPTIRSIRRYHGSPSFRARNTQSARPRPAQKETQRPVSRILQFVRTSSILAPFRRLNAALSRIPGPYRRFIGNTMKLTPIFLLVFLHFPYQIMHTNGSSMSPFLNPNNAPHLPESHDRILVKRVGGFDLWGYWLSRLSRSAIGDGAERPLRRGEIVVFLTPHDSSKIAVKRIVGLPGDVVKPLEGYEGDKEVTVQHNHIWVEGDADDREKSRDSNWYGPISQSLLIGRVVAIMEPWWSPRWLDLEEHKWPARQKGRVIEDAATADPYQEEWKQTWLEGRAQNMLSVLETKSTWLTNQLITSTDKRKEAARLYAAAWKERSTNDARTKEATGTLVETLGAIFTKAGLQVVMDEQDDSNVDLIRTPEGEQLLRDHYRKKPDEELYSPEQLLQRRRRQLDNAYMKHMEELAHFDEWSWHEKYRPKSVLKARLERLRKEGDEQQRVLEKELERERRVEEGERGFRHGGGKVVVEAEGKEVEMEVER